MLRDQAETLARHAKAIWPMMTADTVRMLANDLSQLDHDLSRGVLKAMKEECKTFTFTEFTSRFQAAKVAARKARAEADLSAPPIDPDAPMTMHESIIEILRENLAIGRHNAALPADHPDRIAPLVIESNVPELRRCRHANCERGWLITEHTGRVTGHLSVAPCPACQPEAATRWLTPSRRTA